jgi:hypothetical protein
MKSVIKIILCVIMLLPGISLAGSVPEENPPRPDWIFTVPINVQNLHPDVKKLGIICETSFTAMKGIKGLPKLPGLGKAEIIKVGKGKVRIPVQGGKFLGNATVPVQAGSALPDWNRYSAKEQQAIFNHVDRYECKMYMVNQNGDWRVPTKDDTRGWLAADPRAPFRWSTDRKNLPR